MKNVSKLKSRKFWLTFIIAVLILFAEKLGLDVNHLQELVVLAGTYLLSQGWVDGKAAEMLGEVMEEVEVTVEDKDA